MSCIDARAPVTSSERAVTSEFKIRLIIVTVIIILYQPCRSFGKGKRERAGVWSRERAPVVQLVLSHYESIYLVE